MAELPDQLRIVCEARHVDEVEAWWDALDDEQRDAFLSVAALTPEQLGTRVDFPPDEDAPADRPNDWYEYIVNRDLRFFFDQSFTSGQYRFAYSTMLPVDVAADARVLRRRRR